MRKRALVFAIFAAAMLFSMMREWSGSVGCPRVMVHAHKGIAGR